MMASDSRIVAMMDMKNPFHRGAILAVEAPVADSTQVRFTIKNLMDQDAQYLQDWRPFVDVPKSADKAAIIAALLPGANMNSADSIPGLEHHIIKIYRDSPYIVGRVTPPIRPFDPARRELFEDMNAHRYGSSPVERFPSVMDVLSVTGSAAGTNSTNSSDTTSAPPPKPMLECVYPPLGRLKKAGKLEREPLGTYWLQDMLGDVERGRKEATSELDEAKREARDALDEVIRLELLLKAEQEVLATMLARIQPIIGSRRTKGINKLAGRKGGDGADPDVDSHESDVEDGAPEGREDSGAARCKKKISGPPSCAQSSPDQENFAPNPSGSTIRKRRREDDELSVPDNTSAAFADDEGDVSPSSFTSRKRTKLSCSKPPTQHRDLVPPIATLPSGPPSSSVFHLDAEQSEADDDGTASEREVEHSALYSSFASSNGAPDVEGGSSSSSSSSNESEGGDGVPWKDYEANGSEDEEEEDGDFKISSEEESEDELEEEVVSDFLPAELVFQDDDSDGGDSEDNNGIPVMPDHDLQYMRESGWKEVLRIGIPDTLNPDLLKSLFSKAIPYCHAEDRVRYLSEEKWDPFTLPPDGVAVPHVPRYRPYTFGFERVRQGKDGRPEVYNYQEEPEYEGRIIADAQRNAEAQAAKDKYHAPVMKLIMERSEYSKVWEGPQLNEEPEPRVEEAPWRVLPPAIEAS